MSYDLYLKPRCKDFSAGDFGNYFRDRKNYVVQGKQARYENEDTGVYFVFQLKEFKYGREDPDSTGDYPVEFSLNYFRPSYFVLEAEFEIARVIDDFDFLVLDPQSHGMGQGDYDGARFISGWNTGNELAYRSILCNPARAEPVYSMPSQKLESIWRWNYSRAKLQETLGELVFVPRVFFLRRGDKAFSTLIWSDAIPTAFKEIDAVLICREEYAPKTSSRNRETLLNLVPWSEVLELIGPLSRRLGDAIVFDYGHIPKEVSDYFLNLPAKHQEIEGVAADQVLNRELIE